MGINFKRVGSWINYIVENNELYMSWLTDERDKISSLPVWAGYAVKPDKWKSEIEQGIWHEPYILQQYRINRNSNLWRSTREVEKLCEYVIYLESLSRKIEKDSHE